jgi:CspA family cold shock protein
MGKGRDYRGPRRRGFDDDTFTPQDAAASRPARFSKSQPQGAAIANGNATDAVVKWFNTEKGFGFVELADGSGDAFLHISVLQAAGHDSIEPGNKLKVQVEQGQKGRQISAVFEVDTSATLPDKLNGSREHRAADRTPNQSTAVEVDGTVKWFNTAKGFGFIGVDDGGKDVFLHIKVLEKAGRKTIAEGELVTMQVVQGQKGREAISITVVPPIG